MSESALKRVILLEETVHVVCGWLPLEVPRQLGVRVREMIERNAVTSFGAEHRARDAPAVNRPSKRPARNGAGVVTPPPRDVFDRQFLRPWSEDRRDDEDEPWRR